MTYHAAAAEEPRLAVLPIRSVWPTDYALEEDWLAAPVAQTRLGRAKLVLRFVSMVRLPGSSLVGLC